MPEEPDAAHARRRARAQLLVPRPQAVLRPCGPAGGRDRGAPARGLMKRIACIAVAWLLVVAAACAAQVLPSWNDGPAKEAIVRFVTDVTTPETSTFVARRPHRGLRQRRHVVGRAAGARAVRIRARPCQGARAAASRVEGTGPVQVDTRRRRRACARG